MHQANTPEFVRFDEPKIKKIGANVHDGIDMLFLPPLRTSSHFDAVYVASPSCSISSP
jgi:hypothetical protein